MRKSLLVSAVIVLVGMSMPNATFAKDAVNKTIVMQDEVTYKEIKVEELPTEVVASLQKAYKDATIANAFVGDDGSYKVIVKIGEETKTVYVKADGEII